MKNIIWLVLFLLLTSACQNRSRVVTIQDGDQFHPIKTMKDTPAEILRDAGISIGENDRLIFLGSKISLDAPLPDARSCTLIVYRANPLTIITPDGERTIQTSALTIGQALVEAGLLLNRTDLIDPPVETPLKAFLSSKSQPSVAFQPAKEFDIAVDGKKLGVRSGAGNVGEVLSEAGIPLLGLDYSLPMESDPLPSDGQIHVVRVSETVALTQKSIPADTRTELSDLVELDQQALIQAGEPGLALTRLRTRFEDGAQISQLTESESIVRPPQDRIMGIGTKIVIRTAVVDGETITYYRALRLYSTSYSPCQSASPDGRCLYGTSSGLPVQRGTVAMVYSWYIAFGFDRLYVPGYGYAFVGDVGAGSPPGNHYWIDLGWTDAEYQPMSGWTTVYFLTPLPKNFVYVLP